MTPDDLCDADTLASAPMKRFRAMVWTHVARVLLPILLLHGSQRRIVSILLFCPFLMLSVPTFATDPAGTRALRCEAAAMSSAAPALLQVSSSPVSVTPAQLPAVPDETLIPTVQTLKTEGPGWKAEQKNFLFSGNGTVFIRKISFSQSQSQYVTAYTMPGENVTLHWFDTLGNLITQPLKNGSLPLNSMLILQSESYCMLVGQCFTYEELGRGTIRDRTGIRQAVEAKKNGNGTWTITSRFNRLDGTYGILWGVGSKNPLLDPGTPLNSIVWPGYDLVKKARLGYDGYYYVSPQTYSPYAENAFWRIPSMYLANSFIQTGGSPASALLGNAMLANALPNLSAAGWFPTLPESSTLKARYNIGAGFFDTRFNADAARSYLVGYRKTGNVAFQIAANRLADWFMTFGKSHHFCVASGAAEGWLVQDYGETPGAKPAHCALNHQLAIIILFLDMAYDCPDESKAAEYRAFAEKLLDGVRLTKDKWMMENGNLEYAWMPDGTMGLVDYPYLTYNDLCEAQDLLVKLTGKRDPSLDVLRESKQKWMDANGITQYRKW